MHAILTTHLTTVLQVIRDRLEPQDLAEDLPQVDVVFVFSEKLVELQDNRSPQPISSILSLWVVFLPGEVIAQFIELCPNGNERAKGEGWVCLVKLPDRRIVLSKDVSRLP